MSAKRKAILAVLLSAVVLFGALHVLSAIFIPKYWSVNVRAYEMWNCLYTEPKDTIDVLYLGPSTFYNGLMPTEMYAAHGQTSLLLSVPHMRMSMAELYLKEALRYQKPKVVVLENMLHLSMAYDLRENAYRIAYSHLRPSWDKFKALVTLSRNSSQSLTSWLFPFLRFHDRWNSLTLADLNLFAKPEHYAEKGWTNSARTTPFTLGAWKLPTDEIDDSFDAEALACLKRVQAICEENGIALLLCAMPVMSNANSFQQGTEYTYAMMNASEQLCAAWGIDYLDLNHLEIMAAMDLDPATDFSTRSHLNTKGAVKATAYVGEYLASRYDLPDRREDAAVAPVWNEDVLTARATYLEEWVEPKVWSPLRAEAAEGGTRLTWPNIQLYDDVTVTRRADGAETRTALPRGASDYVDANAAYPCAYDVTFSIAGRASRAVTLSIALDAAGNVIPAEDE